MTKEENFILINSVDLSFLYPKSAKNGTQRRKFEDIAPLYQRIKRRKNKNAFLPQEKKGLKGKHGSDLISQPQNGMLIAYDVEKSFPINIKVAVGYKVSSFHVHLENLFP